ncbi:Ribosomal protein S14, mitochondrial [Linum grandiflorum]
MWEDEPKCIKDHNRRLLAEKFELKRNLYKAFIRDPELPAEIREKSRLNCPGCPGIAPSHGLETGMSSQAALVVFMSSSECLVSFSPH